MRPVEPTGNTAAPNGDRAGYVDGSQARNLDPNGLPTQHNGHSDEHGPQWSLRSRLAEEVGTLAARLSRAAGRGEGGVIGGRVTLKLQPEALAHLTRGKTTVLITGTNGKTTTTGMIAHSVGALGPVATNRGGANMPDGLVTALTRDRQAAHCVLEVDETYLPGVVKQVDPAVVVLLNLSRDQIDRVGEVRRIERLLRNALAECPGVTVVANCDDVLVTSIALATARPVWVAAGAAWQSDAAVCPRCGDAIRKADGRWWCVCGLARPEPNWTRDQHGVGTPDGRRYPFKAGVPGQGNAGNALMAIAASVTLGVPLRDALYRVASINDVAGRYRTVDYQDRKVRLLLAKNPAGWQDTLTVVTGRSAPLVLAINARAADGRDVSWLWDVPFEQLAGRQVIATGERAADLAVRLVYARVPHIRVDDPAAAITSLPPGPVDVIANYTAFRELGQRIANA
jgi:lipid II isoglutaminyl synthase (glutamine-hydrolysing)